MAGVVRSEGVGVGIHTRMSNYFFTVLTVGNAFAKLQKTTTNSHPVIATQRVPIMNFKSIAIAASLMFAAGASFADIDMSTSSTNDIATIAPMSDSFATAGGLATAFAATQAIIIQEGTGNVALIEQADKGAGLNFAAVYQQATSAGAVGYISQGPTAANSRAVINQK